jgi:hypothetical protein
MPLSPMPRGTHQDWLADRSPANRLRAIPAADGPVGRSPLFGASQAAYGRDNRVTWRDLRQREALSMLGSLRKRLSQAGMASYNATVARRRVTRRVRKAPWQGAINTETGSFRMSRPRAVLPGCITTRSRIVSASCRLARRAQTRACRNGNLQPDSRIVTLVRLSSVNGRITLMTAR